MQHMGMTNGERDDRRGPRVEDPTVDEMVNHAGVRGNHHFALGRLKTSLALAAVVVSRR